MATLIDKLRQFFTAKQKAGAVTPALREAEVAVPTNHSFNDASLTRLLRQIEATQEGQYSCEETSALLDEYVDLVVSKQDAVRLMPLVEAHLCVCRECSLRYNILLKVLEAEEI